MNKMKDNKDLKYYLSFPWTYTIETESNLENLITTQFNTLSTKSQRNSAP